MDRTRLRNTDEALAYFAEKLLEDETPEVGSRVGRVKELELVNFEISRPLEREIVNPNRKANVVAQIAETMWVLSGRNDLKWLSHYLPRAIDFSDDGETWRAGYGPRLRAWPSDHGLIDQLAETITLLREDRLTRRAVISLYDPARDTGVQSKDIPCNNWLSFSCRSGRLDLQVGIRSNDLVWGWSGINAFEWSVLLEIVARMVGVSPGRIVYSTTSLHSYEPHWERLGRIVEGYKSGVPTDFQIDSSKMTRFLFARNQVATIEDLDGLFARWFRLEYEIRAGAPVSRDDIDDFPDPMLRSWLYALQWWWSGGRSDYLSPLEGTRLRRACAVGVQPKRPEKTWAQLAAGPLFPRRPSVETISEPTPFVKYVTELHAEKHEAYGDSWKKRGELVSILANIGRKVDRLGGGETEDETSADTAIDLLVYLAKYRWWLWQNGKDLSHPYPISDLLPADSELDAANQIIRETAARLRGSGRYEDFTNDSLEAGLETLFDELFEVASDSRSGKPRRISIVDPMIEDAYELAQRLWHAEQNKTRSWNPELEDDSDLPL